MEQIFFNSIEDWKAARRGLFTASEIKRLMAEPKEVKKREAGELSDGAMTYIYEKASEILTGTVKESYYSFAMQWGTEHEGEAVKAFADLMGIDTNDPEFLYCGGSDPVFYKFSTIAGGSPDVVYTKWIAEFKCPESHTHLQYLLATAENFREKFPDNWIQMQANMLFTEKPLCMFVSYDPRFTDTDKQLKVIPIPADLTYQNLILTKLGKAKTKLDEILAEVNQKNAVTVEI